MNLKKWINSLQTSSSNTHVSLVSYDKEIKEKFVFDLMKELLSSKLEDLLNSGCSIVIFSNKKTDWIKEHFEQNSEYNNKIIFLTPTVESMGREIKKISEQGVKMILVFDQFLLLHDDHLSNKPNDPANVSRMKMKLMFMLKKLKDPNIISAIFLEQSYLLASSKQIAAHGMTHSADSILSIKKNYSIEGLKGSFECPIYNQNLNKFIFY